MDSPIRRADGTLVPANDPLYERIGAFPVLDLPTVDLIARDGIAPGHFGGKE